MEQLDVITDHVSYPVYIGAGVRHEASHLLKDILADKSKAFIITDETVAPLYGEDLKQQLSSSIEVSLYTVAAGEKSKSIETYEELLTACIKEGLDRKSIILALGGGVIGDVAGFTAATYMRGIPFVQVPTTLLAQDSSVGGKTGINHHLGKNLIGAFHQPSAVLYDTETLSSLPDEEWRSGFAEMIKHAYIKDPEFLRWLQTNVEEMDDIKGECLLGFLKRSIAIKADIVKEDEKESGVRAYLNFGHTLGHAIEKESGYGGITHGEAVACGMLFSMKVSNALGHSNWDLEKEANWLRALGYPLDTPSRFSPEHLIQAMKYDKKATGGKISFVLLEESGKPFIEPIDDSVLLSLLKEEEEKT